MEILCVCMRIGLDVHTLTTLTDFEINQSKNVS